MMVVRCILRSHITMNDSGAYHTFFLNLVLKSQMTIAVFELVTYVFPIIDHHVSLGLSTVN